MAGLCFLWISAGFLLAWVWGEGIVGLLLVAAGAAVMLSGCRKCKKDAH